jgi:hypothetical protein
MSGCAARNAAQAWDYSAAAIEAPNQCLSIRPSYAIIKERDRWDIDSPSPHRLTPPPALRRYLTSLTAVHLCAGLQSPDCDSNQAIQPRTRKGGH